MFTDILIYEYIAIKSCSNIQAIFDNFVLDIHNKTTGNVPIIFFLLLLLMIYIYLS